MASRHLSRSLVLQTLFECDMQSGLSEEKSREIFHRDLKDFSRGEVDVPFAETLLKNILGKRDEIDAVIVKAAPEWPLEHIAPIDRNVLRIGLYEILFGDRIEVPPKVALNESIELAKSYGGDTSGKFVNGVLGSVYRSLGEPDKGTSAKESTPIPSETLGGMLVAAVTSDTLSIALVKDAFGRWTLPKSKCLAGESTHSAAERASLEELGIDAKALSPLSDNEYIAHEPGGGSVVRTVSYFFASIPKILSLTPPVGSTGITDARWFNEAEITTVETYDDLMPIIQEGIQAAKKPF